MRYLRLENLIFLNFHVFDYKWFILNNGKESICKLDAKFNEGTFLGYSSTIKAYRVYNHRTSFVEESIHVAFDESLPQKTWKCISSDVLGIITEKTIDDESSKEDLNPSTKD